jgi:glycosyltransferase involved in cell wall biosynthesis
VYYYGPATALCFGYPKVLFPWGYDIRDYADSSRGAFAMVRWALRSADLVVPSSSAAADYICTRFGTTREKVQAVSWGIDQRQFQRADMARRQAILERYGIPPAARVVSNVRRCHPDWGCDLAFEAFCTLAAENPALHFVLLGGAGDLTNQIMGRMRATLAKWGLERRFTLFDRDMPLEEFADVVAVTDVFTSLPQFTDMRSWSVLQAAASGAAPVLTDQEEYRRMTDQGFRALFVPPGRADVVADAVRTLLADETGTSAMTHDNVRYIEQHESWDVHMQRMLQLIDAVCERQKERLL